MFAILSLVLLCASTTESLPFVTLLDTIPQNYTEIQSIGSKKCIGPASGSTAERSQITLQTCSGQAHQAWKFTKLNDHDIKWVNLKGGMCLGVSGASLKSKASLVLMNCQNTVNQRFSVSSLSTVNGVWKIIAVNSGLSLDVPKSDTNDGTPIQQYAYKGGQNQQWQYVAWTQSQRRRSQPAFIMFMIMKLVSVCVCVDAISRVHTDRNCANQHCYV
jgi:glucosylceramidase